MSPTGILESQQSALCQQARRSAAGCWKLTTGTALSLRPRQPGVLEVAEGRIWVTGSDHADHVLEAGQRMTFAAGEHVVLEVWAPTSMDAAAVAPLGAPRAATSPLQLSVGMRPWSPDPLPGSGKRASPNPCGNCCRPRRRPWPRPAASPRGWRGLPAIR